MRMTLSTEDTITEILRFVRNDNKAGLAARSCSRTTHHVSLLNVYLQIGERSLHMGGMGAIK
jgi:hypothetical protein